MVRTNDIKSRIEPKPLAISRMFPVLRDLVFKAWSSAEHMKRWFCPEGYSVPEVEGAGTRMTVHQAYDIHDEKYLFAVEGAPEGWRTTLDKLEREVMRIQSTQGRSIVHATFSLQRVYDVSPAQVFHALSDKAAKARWFEGGDGYTALERAKWMSAPAGANA